MTKVKSLPAFVAANFKLQKNDFWLVALAEAGIWAGVMAVMGILCWFSSDTDFLAIGVPGIAVFAMAVICNLVCAVSRVWLEFAIGVQMSAPRRRMVAAELALNLTMGAELLALAALFNGLWRALYASRMPAENVVDIVQRIPAWGWLAAWLLPVGVGMLGGALVLRFGRRAGWALYFVFLGCCWLPMLLDDWLETQPLVRAAWEWLFPLLPVLGPAAAVAAILAAAVLLLRVALTN